MPVNLDQTQFRGRPFDSGRKGVAMFFVKKDCLDCPAKYGK